MSKFRWLRTAAVAALALSPSPGTSQESSSKGWTGTFTVEENSRYTFEIEARGEPKVEDRVVETTRVTYSLNGDGTASWTATYSQNVSGTCPRTQRGSGSGTTNYDVEFEFGWWRLWIEDAVGRMRVVSSPLGECEEFRRGLYEAGTEDVDYSVSTAGTDWEATADATSHSGSFTEEGKGGLPVFWRSVQSRTTTTWRLAKGPIRPGVTIVTIYGPACGCIKEGESTARLRFVAGTSHSGGEFSEFSVTSDGVEPEILSNEGGEQPMLEIAGTKETGAVTLRITYERDGVHVQSAPLKVEFCSIEDIELADGDEHDLSFDAADKLTVEARAKAWRGGRDISPSLVWELEPMGAPTSLQATPASKKGDQIEFVYSGLPENNTDFGPKRLTARVDGCDCEREETIRTFFPLQNLDDAEDAFKYWKQTTAAPGDARPLMTFVRVIPSRHEGDSVAGRWDFPTQNLLVGAVAFLKGGCRGRRRASDVPGVGMPLGARAEGIDCFAETVRHEMQHRADAIEWWGSPRGSLAVSIWEALWRDPDIDFVPSEVEKARRNCLWRPTQGIDALDIDPGRAQYSCFDRPFRDVSDLEINAYWTGWTWPIGSVDYEDWSCGSVSKQWKGKRCGS